MPYYRNTPYNMRNSRENMCCEKAELPKCEARNREVRNDSCMCENKEPECNNELAIASVPWQKFGPTYDECKAFMVGTVYPCLNKPFMHGGTM